MVLSNKQLEKREGGAQQEQTALSAEQLHGLHNLQRGIGEVAMLLAGHEAYKGMFLGDIRRTVLPAVLHNQYRVIRNKQDRTIGYMSWARVSEAVHKRLMNGRLKLQTAEWMSGKIAVVMDVVAPTVSAGERILREVKEELFAQEVLWVVRSDTGLHEPKLMQYHVCGGEQNE